MLAARLRTALQTTIAAAAAPYGYTLTVWTSGAVLMHEHDVPTAVDALLFMAGAVAGFTLVGAFAYGGTGRRTGTVPVPFSLWHSFHLLAVGGAIGVAVAASRLSGDAAWAVGGFAATVVYLLGAGLQQCLGRRRALASTDGA